jgi:PAS domain S-box-containing protein
MQVPHYDRMSKKDLIDRLVEAERQLHRSGAEKGPGRAPATRQSAGKTPGSEEQPDPASFRKESKRVKSARPAGTEIKSASESDYTILDNDGRIRRLYKVVKDIRDDAGNPLFSEGALYEISSQPPGPGNSSDVDLPDVPGESDQTELICRFRPNGALTYVNEAYCRYFGCERDELQDLNILLSISEADREKVYSRLKDLRPERPVDTLECRVVTVFGDILWNQWTYRALFDDGGNILEYQSVGRDITFRKYTQDILEKRAAILEAVTFAAEGFLKSSSWRDRIERVLERFGAAMNASHVFLCENRIGQQGEIAVLRSYEWLSPRIKGVGHRKKFLRNSELAVRFSRWVYEKSEGRPIVGTIGHFPDQDVAELALDKKMSIAVMPVLLGERWWGFIGFADYSGEIEWTEDEIAPLGAASEILGSAIEREEKERALEETHVTIRDQERFLAGVFDAIQDGIMVAAPDMTILRVNKTIEKRFSHAPTLPGRKCYEAYYGLNSPCSGCASQKTIKTGKPASMTRSVTGPDGEFKGWVDVFSYPWIDHSTGKLKGIIEYSRDITERKKAEDARLQSEERLDTFLNSFRDPVFLKDSDRRYLFVNEAGLSLLGRTREEIIGKTDSEMFDTADAAEREKEKTDLRLLTQGGGPLLYEQRIKGRILETTKFQVNLENGRVGIGGILRDVTERKQAEEALRASEALQKLLLQNIDAGVLIIDAKTHVTERANSKALEMFGGTEEKVIGKECQRFVCPAEKGRCPVTDLGQVIDRSERVLLTSDGSRVPIIKTAKSIGIGGEEKILETFIDITERKLAEEALRASEVRYRELADTIPAGVYEATVDGYFTYANRTAMEMYGYGEDDIRKGVHFLQVIAPEDHDTAKRRSQAVREDQTLPDMDYTFVRKDGSHFPGLLMSKPLKRNGQVAGLMGVVTDISALKEAQNALRKNEAMLQSILRAVPVGIAFGHERTLQWSNDFYQRMTGYGEDDASGRTARLLYESEEEFHRVGKEIFSSIAKGGIGETQTRWKRKDGSMIDVFLSVSPLDSDDTAQGVVISALDVTEKKKADEALRASEARYRELADNMPAGIYEATLDGRIVYVNKTALDMFGYSADEVEKGVTFSRVIAPESLEDLARNVYKIREGAAFGHEYAMLRKDGSRFFGLNMARPITKDGRVVGSTGIITDVSELRKVQEALRKNEALLGSILRAAPIGVGMVHDRVLGWVNEGMSEMTGYAVDELKGKSARIVYPDDEEFERAGREKYAKIAARGKGAVETRFKRKDGSLIDVHLSSAPIDPANLAAGVVFTALDITAQKKAARILLFAKEDLEKQVADQTRELDVSNMLLKIELEEHRKTEEALVKSEQLYRAIVEDQTEFICRFHPDGTLSFVNDAFCRFFGKIRKELLGTRYRPMPLDDQLMVKNALRSLSPKNPVIHLEFRTECPDGEIRWMQWSNRAIYDDAGTLVEHQAVGRDITDRKQSELQIRESRNMLRAVFDGISDPLIMVREDMTLIMLNRAALRFFGALLYRDMIGTSCLEFFLGRYGEEATRLVRARIAEQEPARCELTTTGDSSLYEEVFVYPVLAGGEDRCTAIIRITDRTKQRLMERELIQSEKLASLGLLISGIVHEINNPNNFISFNMPILRDYLREILPVLDQHTVRTPQYEVQGMPYAEFRADVMKLLDNIEHGSVRINTTVAKLKEFARKKDEKGVRSIQPTGVVERAVAICHTQIRKTVKTFDVQVEQDMPEMFSDPDAIEQPLINLLINAAQAADKPDSYIRLGVRREDSGRGGLVLEVEDNGCGMDSKTISRIFDPFFTTKEEGLGTGLGLYITKNLIDTAGGSISVKSEIGRGTTIRVVLPDLGEPVDREEPFKQKGVGK